MITLTLVAVLGALLVVVLMQLKKSPAAPPAAAAPPPVDLANLKVTDARPGDVISISGAGDDLSDLDFTSDRCAWYEAGARRWFELSGPYRERRVTLRVGGNEEVEASLQSDPRKVTIEDLGLGEEDLAQMDERQNTADNFEFDGHVWQYLLSREVQVKRSDLPQPFGLYFWEFHEQDGKRLLAIRKSEGEPFSVTLYAGISPGDVTVYRGSRT